MRYPTHNPMPAPPMNASAMGGIAFTNRSSPSQTTLIIAAKNTSVSTTRKATDAVLKVGRSFGTWPQHMHATREGKAA